MGLSSLYIGENFSSLFIASQGIHQGDFDFVELSYSSLVTITLTSEM